MMDKAKAGGAIMKATNEITKARRGVWTPWARVLCVECEHAHLKSSAHGEFYARRLKVVAALSREEETARPAGELIGLCEECRCACWVRDDVALLQQVGFRASDLDWEGPFGWELRQTGGMCAALVFSTEGREIVVTAMDAAFYVGEYAVIEGEEASWDQPLRTWESASLYDDDQLKAAPALGAMSEECTRKAIEFIRNPDAAHAPA